AVGDVVRAVPDGEVGAGQVRRAADQFGQARAVGVERHLRGLARGDFGAFFLRPGDVGVGDVGPVVGQFAGHAALQFGGQVRVCLGVFFQQRVPFGFALVAGFAGVVGGVVLVGNLERRVTPVEHVACGGDFVGAEGGTVGLGGVFLVRRAEADDRLADDQRGLFGFGNGFFDGLLYGLGVMPVDVADDMPAAGLETPGGVVGEPARDLAVDGNGVVVVDHFQVAELPGAGERNGFLRDAFHQAAVAAEHPGPVIDDAVVGFVEAFGEHFFGQG